MHPSAIRAAGQSSFSRYLPPHNPSPSPSPSDDVDGFDAQPHWERSNVGTRLRRYNPPHQWVRSLVPAALQPERVAAARVTPPDIERFRVNEDDATRGALMVAATQVTLGSFGAAMVVDGVWGGGPTFVNPEGRVDPALAFGASMSALLGFTALGASVGNLWYNGLLSASARAWPTLSRHRNAADFGAATGGVICAMGAVMGATLLAADFLQRSLAAPPAGPAPANAIYEYTAALALMTTGPFFYGCSGWYLGRLVGGGLAEAFTPRQAIRLDEERSEAETFDSGTYVPSSSDDASDHTVA